MKIHILSDLHVEFAPFELQVLDADVVILAGDIHVGMAAVRWAELLLNQTSAHIVFICGNHEFYRENITKLRSEMNFFVVTRTAMIGNIVYITWKIVL